MKDAHGHGSDGRGMANRANAGNHQAGVLRVGRPGHKIQELDTKLAGQPFRTVKSVGNNTVAERVAQYLRVDNPNGLYRTR